MRLRGARIFTALAVIALCGLAVSHGWGIARFAIARTGVASQPDAVRPWIAVPGIAAAALEASLTEVADAGDADAAGKRSEELSAVLAVHPLSSATWLSLAGMRLVAHQPYDKVLGALTMSLLTGANEGSIMMQRGTFGLVQWEVLPADMRKRIIADLAGAILETGVRDSELVPAKNVLAAKAAETRREISNLLRAEQVPAKELARMGL
jgi:hypothetical protein